MTPFDATGAFCPVAEHAKLRHLALRGAGATVSASALGLAIQVISTVLLARLLTPADFGVVTMVTTFSLLLVSFGWNGFIQAIIQCEEIDRHTASNLFWLSWGIGLGLAAAFAASGSLLARFYQNALAAKVAAEVSVQIFVAAGSTIHVALLKRAMRFAAASGNEVAGRATYSVVALLLAWKGWSYHALVAGYVAQGLSTTVGAWWLCRWMPNLPRRTGRTWPLVRFAASVYGRFGVRYCTQNIDNVLVGWQFNARALGLYKKAYDLFALSATQLTAPLHDVALAALSRISREPARFRRNLLDSLGILAFVGMAVGADLTLVGRDVVRLVLGPQWGAASRIFVFFGPGIGIMLLYSTVGWIHLSVGRPDRWLRWAIVEFLLTALLLGAGLHWGPEGEAIAWSVSYWSLLVPAFWYAGKPIELGVGPLLGAVWRYLAASVIAGGACALTARQSPLLGAPASATAALAALVLVSVVFVSLYLAAVIVLHGGCAPLRQFQRLMGQLAPQRFRRRTAEAVAGSI
jgi:PST family polysaccharide transporter